MGGSAEHPVLRAKTSSSTTRCLVQQTPQGQMEVMLVAAKREVVGQYIQVVRDAGFQPTVVDAAAFSLQNAVEGGVGFSPGETVAIVNVGRNVFDDVDRPGRLADLQSRPRRWWKHIHRSDSHALGGEHRWCRSLQGRRGGGGGGRGGRCGAAGGPPDLGASLRAGRRGVSALAWTST